MSTFLHEGTKRRKLWLCLCRLTRKTLCMQLFFFFELACIRRQIEVKDGDDGDEDARQDDVQHVVERLPLDDQVEGHLLVLIVVHVLPARLMSDDPLASLC